MAPQRRPAVAGLGVLVNSLYSAMFRRAAKAAKDEKEVELETFTEAMLMEMCSMRHDSWEDSPAASVAGLPLTAPGTKGTLKRTLSPATPATPHANPDATLHDRLAAAQAQQESLAHFCLDFISYCLEQPQPAASPAQDQLPMQQLVAICSDGMIPCKLINAFVPGTVDERALDAPIPQRQRTAHAAAPPARSPAPAPLPHGMSIRTHGHPRRSCDGAGGCSPAGARSCDSGSTDDASSSCGSCNTCSTWPYDAVVVSMRHAGSSGALQLPLSPEAAAANLVLVHSSAQCIGCRLEGVELRGLAEGEAHTWLALVADILTTGILMHLAPLLSHRLGQLGSASAAAARAMEDEDEEEGEEAMLGSSSVDPEECLVQWMGRCLGGSATPSSQGSVSSGCGEEGDLVMERLGQLVGSLLRDVRGQGQVGCTQVVHGGEGEAEAEVHGGEGGRASVASVASVAEDSAWEAVSPQWERGEEMERRLCGALLELEAAAAEVSGRDRGSGERDGGFRLDPRHLRGRAPKMMVLCLAAALRASKGLPLWLPVGGGELGEPEGRGQGALGGADVDVVVGPAEERAGRSDGGSGLDAAAAEQPCGDAAAPAPAPEEEGDPEGAAAAACPSAAAGGGGATGPGRAPLGQGPTAAGGTSWQRRPQQPVRNGGGDKDGVEKVSLRSWATCPKPVPEKPKPKYVGHLHNSVVDPDEERLLHLWMNSLDPRICLPSLFNRRMRTGWPLLLAVDAIQPGSVNWGQVFPLPFKDKVQRIMGVCNCNIVVSVCRSWCLPLVNIGGIDIAEGSQTAILSLIWQLMRHHLRLQLVMQPEAHGTRLRCGSGSGACPGTGPALSDAAGACSPSGGSAGGAGIYDSGLWRTGSVVDCAGAQWTCSTPREAGGTPKKAATHGGGTAPREAGGTAAGAAGSPAPAVGSAQIEGLVLHWANQWMRRAGLGLGLGLGAGAGPGPLGPLGPLGPGAEPLAAVRGEVAGRGVRSLEDPRLVDGGVLLDLLAAICPGAVHPLHVLPGASVEEREANAKYILSILRKLGCSIFLVWQDLIAASAKSSLILLATMMALDMRLKRRREEEAAAA